MCSYGSSRITCPSASDPLSAESGDIDPASLVVTYNDGTSDVVLTASGGKYTIPAGVTALTVKVPTVNDAVYEGSETFTLSANVTQSYVTDTDMGTGTIKDDGTASDGDDSDSLMARADALLYEAKLAGRNRVSFST